MYYISKEGFFFFFLGAVWYLFNDIENSVHFVPKFEAAEIERDREGVPLSKLQFPHTKSYHLGRK